MSRRDHLIFLALLAWMLILAAAAGWVIGWLLVHAGWGLPA